MRFYHRLIRTLRLPGNAAPGTPQLVLGPDIPAELNSFYGGAGITMVACILAYSGTNTYEYTLWFYTASTGLITMVEGYTISGIVRPWSTFSMAPTFDKMTLAYNLTAINGGLIQLQGNHPTVASVLSLLQTDFQIDSVSQGRGVVVFAASSADTGSVGTSFTKVLTKGSSFTLKAGRAYSVDVGGGAYSTSLTTNEMEVRVNWVPNHVETAMFDAASFGPEFNSGRNAVHNRNVVVVNTTTVSDDIYVYCKATSGTVNWLGNYSTQNRSNRYVMVTDIGAASSFPGAIALN